MSIDTFLFVVTIPYLRTTVKMGSNSASAELKNIVLVGVRYQSTAIDSDSDL